MKASVTLLISLLFGAEGPSQKITSVDFNSQILPILSRNCFSCHGPDAESRQADLRLDLRDHALRTEKPVLVPRHPDQSLLVSRIKSDDPNEKMPPLDSKRQLTDSEIKLLTRWIEEGASWSEHWAFKAVRRSLPPAVVDGSWTLDPADQYVLAKLESQKIDPSPAANRETLLRRVTFDLIGLPPTAEERREFIADEHPDAYERVVDRLLASPHYGERWGRHWLDVARYADSSGFEGDMPRDVWKYRDWVISAINADLPFDDFVVYQIAGDLLPGVTDADRIATGFLLNSQQDGGTEPARLDAVVDRVNTVGAVFLGLTLGCAQCHAHKFDPINQAEFYGIFAFINAADERKLEFASPEQLARRDALQAQLDALIAERTAYSAKMPANVAKSDPGYQERSTSIEELKRRIPVYSSALVLQPAPESRVTTTYVRGDYSQPGPVIKPGVPAILPSLPEGQRTRLEFAKWLVSANQPLTPRVTANRSWQILFGRGLVETENDFGVQGARPTHSELLDWLAVEFVQSGWQSKRLHRLIVQTATYRQSSERDQLLDSIDPDNRLLARQSRLRLEAESVRDAALAVGDLLSSRIGGPSVFPFQHDGILLNRATPATWTISSGEDRYRRGMYTWYWRLTPHPQMQTFDAPDAIATCTRRVRSSTPLQALSLLNDPTFDEAATALTNRVLKQSSADQPAKIIDEMFELCFSRMPSDAEREVLHDVLKSAKTRSLSSQPETDLSREISDRAAWLQVARTMINLEEFIMRE